MYGQHPLQDVGASLCVQPVSVLAQVAHEDRGSGCEVGEVLGFCASTQ